MKSRHEKQAERRPADPQPFVPSRVAREMFAEALLHVVPDQPGKNPGGMNPRGSSVNGGHQSRTYPKPGQPSTSGHDHLRHQSNDASISRMESVAAQMTLSDAP